MSRSICARTDNKARMMAGTIYFMCVLFAPSLHSGMLTSPQSPSDPERSPPHVYHAAYRRRVTRARQLHDTLHRAVCIRRPTHIVL